MDLGTGTLIAQNGPAMERMLKTANRSRMVWSAISEPGDRRTGVLVCSLGPQEALRWAMLPFEMPRTNGEPLADPEATDGGASATTGSGLRGLRTVWGRVHQRLQPRIAEFSYEKEMRSLESVGGRIVFPGDIHWPPAFDLLEERSPFALWVAGSLPVASQPTVALVGARAATAYGVSMAGTLGYESSDAGVTVLSGGAYGIDAAAHRGAVRANTPPEVPTVAVLCGGLGNPYPTGNSRLFEEVVSRGGALVTEMPPSSRPARWRFLQRNRLISAWSDMVVIVEAGRRSGALATANRALDIGVTVGAVPGPVTSVVSNGTNDLLKTGAVVVTDVDDILFQVTGRIRPLSATGEVSREKGTPTNSLDDLTELQRRTWDGLPVHGSAPLARVASETGLSEAEVTSAFAVLERKDLVRRTEAGWGRRASA